MRVVHVCQRIQPLSPDPVSGETGESNFSNYRVNYKIVL
jgi:hypothetical protein